MTTSSRYQCADTRAAHAVHTTNAMTCAALLLSTCPDCDVGRLARRQFFSDALGDYGVMAFAPIAVVVLVVWWLDRWFLQRDKEVRGG